MGLTAVNTNYEFTAIWPYAFNHNHWYSSVQIYIYIMRYTESVSCWNAVSTVNMAGAASKGLF